MATQNKPIPAKLKEDAIVEALLEVRFEMITLPEIFFGRVADHAPWKAFQQQQLPAYQIPAPIRQADPNLRYAPVFELRDASTNRFLRIGPQVLSFHQTAPYSGWAQFQQELFAAIDTIFSTSEGLIVRRLGIRYLNALRPDAHRIRSITDLDLRVAIANESISSNVNINFTRELSADTECTTRIATREFVQGALPPNTSVVIDVDVFTKEHFNTKESTTVKDWLELAHTQEKEQFFRLLTDQAIDFLRES